MVKKERKERYDYPITVASKVIIRKGNSILLTREPLDHTWMPGRLGLPGGKLLLNESILDGTERKIKEETSLKCKPTGLFKIINILMPRKTVYHFIFIADYLSGKVDLKNLYSADLRWFNKEEIMKLTKDDLTEYYLDEVFQEYFKSPNKFISLDILKTLFSFKNKDIQSWMAKGTIKE